MLCYAMLLFSLAQTEALRGDPEGFARQQLMLNDASELVTLARAKVAELEANTPSFKEVWLCVICMINARALQLLTLIMYA